MQGMKTFDKDCITIKMQVQRREVMQLYTYWIFINLVKYIANEVRFDF